MRPITGSNLAVAERDFATHARLSIDGVLVKDVLGYNPLMGATWDHDIDSPVASGQITVDLGGRAGLTSPWHSGSAVLDGRPLFDAGRVLVLETATTAREAAPTSIDWHHVFDARIDDYDPAQSTDDTLTIVARDLLSDILDGWFKDTLGASPTPFGDANVDLVLYAFLTATFGPVPPLSFVVDPSPAPSFFVAGATYDPASCLLTMRQIALATGWDLRGGYARGGLGPEEWGIIYQDVKRSETTPSWSFAPWRYDRPSRMLVSRNTVRNWIRVIPNTTDRTPIEVHDDASILLYREHFMELDEGLASHVNTAPEGTALANYALSDLKDPKAEWVVPMPYWYATEMHDRYEFQPATDGIHFDQPTILAVSGYRHTLENGEARTELRLRRNAAAANREWRSNRPADRYIRSFDAVGPGREGALWIVPEA